MTDTVAPPLPRRPKRSFAPLVLALAAGIAIPLLLIDWSRHDSPRQLGSRFEFRAGFTGPVKVLYEIPGAPPLPVKDGYRVLQIPSTGLLETSSRMLYGKARDRYFRANPDGSMAELDRSMIKIRKNGLVGDKTEYFRSPTELQLRDKEFVRQGRFDKDLKNVLGGPYEILYVRDDLE